MTATKKLVITAMCAALCVVLPYAFHAIPDFGSIFSPIHIPVLLCGLICGWHCGLLCGIVAPLLSSFITGMPPIGYLPPMLVELAVYGAVAGLIMTLVRTKHLYADLYISLIPAMLVGRILAGLARGFIFAPGGYSYAMWVSGYFVKAIPGIITHLIIIPLLVLALEKARLIQARYPKA